MFNRVKAWYYHNGDKVDALITDLIIIGFFAIVTELANDNRRLRDEHFDNELRALIDGGQ